MDIEDFERLNLNVCVSRGNLSVVTGTETKFAVRKPHPSRCWVSILNPTRGKNLNCWLEKVAGTW